MQITKKRKEVERREMRNQEETPSKVGWCTDDKTKKTGKTRVPRFKRGVQLKQWTAFAM